MVGSKLKGIDLRWIKCASTSPNSKEAGISFDRHQDNYVLLFHYLLEMGPDHYHQVSEGMVLNKENTKQLIKELKKLKF